MQGDYSKMFKKKLNISRPSAPQAPPAPPKPPEPQLTIPKTPRGLKGFDRMRKTTNISDFSTTQIREKHTEKREGGLTKPPSNQYKTDEVNTMNNDEILSVRANKRLVDEFKSLPGENSDNLREAIERYISYRTGLTDTPVNNENISSIDTKVDNLFTPCKQPVNDNNPISDKDVKTR